MTAKRQRLADTKYEKQVDARCGRLGIVRHEELASIKRGRLTSLADPR